MRAGWGGDAVCYEGIVGMQYVMRAGSGGVQYVIRMGWGCSML